MSKSLFSSSLVVGIGTMLSRVLGLVRDVVFAGLLGANANADVFYLAFKIPNFLRRLFAEGAFAQAFVPVLVEYKQKGDFSLVQLLVARVFGALGGALLLVTAVFVLFAPWLSYLFATGFHGDAGKLELMGELLRITFPYLFLISLVAFSGSILNSYNKFSIPALTPIWLNLSLIFAALVMVQWFESEAHALAWGVILAGTLQLAFQIPSLIKLRLLVRPQFKLKDEGVNKILVLMAPAILGVSVSQINLFLDTWLASFLQDGSISWLYLSDRLSELPLGIIGIAIGTVILPKLAGSFSDKNESEFKRTQTWAIKLVLLIGLPSAMALMYLALPLMSTIFFHGAMTADSTVQASYSLMAYAAGLPAFMLIKVLAPGFFARQDMKTPVKIAIRAMVMSMVLNLIFIYPFGHIGLALSTSLAAWFNAGSLYYALKRENLVSLDNALLVAIFKMMLSVLVMVGVLYYLNQQDIWWLEVDKWMRIGHTAMLVIVGILAYFSTAIVLGFRMKDFVGR